jgi:hypothetical protein
MNNEIRRKWIGNVSGTGEIRTASILFGNYERKKTAWGDLRKHVREILR